MTAANCRYAYLPSQRWQCIPWQNILKACLVVPCIKPGCIATVCWSQVVSRTLIDVVDAFPPSFTETNAPVDSSVVTKEAILQAPCGATTCSLYKDTVLVPPGSITTIRLRTAAKPGLFQWHW